MWKRIPPSDTAARRSVEIAAMVGRISRIKYVKMFTGSVRTSVPRKRETTTSSQDVKNANAAVVATLGAMSLIVTCQNA
jgi:hypothetical protein